MVHEVFVRLPRGFRGVFVRFASVFRAAAVVDGVARSRSDSGVAEVSGGDEWRVGTTIEEAENGREEDSL